MSLESVREWLAAHAPDFTKRRVDLCRLPEEAERS
ncbi:MAG: hypothetical protein QOE50_321 [Sphingomonadales bacterium]|jgi:hypothetical protein|nr:hypothetical protein [Sphingomonadales bacterium]